MRFIIVALALMAMFSTASANPCNLPLNSTPEQDYQAIVVHGCDPVALLRTRRLGRARVQQTEQTAHDLFPDMDDMLAMQMMSQMSGQTGGSSVGSGLSGLAGGMGGLSPLMMMESMDVDIGDTGEAIMAQQMMGGLNRGGAGAQTGGLNTNNLQTLALLGGLSLSKPHYTGQLRRPRAEQHAQRTRDLPFEEMLDNMEDMNKLRYQQAMIRNLVPKSAGSIGNAAMSSVAVGSPAGVNPYSQLSSMLGGNLGTLALMNGFDRRLTSPHITQHAHNANFDVEDMAAMMMMNGGKMGNLNGQQLGALVATDVVDDMEDLMAVQAMSGMTQTATGQTAPNTTPSTSTSTSSSSSSSSSANNNLMALGMMDEDYAMASLLMNQGSGSNSNNQNTMAALALSDFGRLRAPRPRRQRPSRLVPIYRKLE